MMKKKYQMMWMLLFLVLPLVALGYVGWHVWTLLPWPAEWRAVAVAVGVGCFLLLFLDLGRRLDAMPLSLARACYEVGTSSLMVLLYVVMLFLVLDVGRLVGLVPRSWLVANGLSAAVLALLVAGVFVYGNVHYRHKVRVPVELTTQKRLPRSYRLVMASDLHLGYHNARRELARWVDLINAEHPDLVLIAGDIIDISVRPLMEEQMAAEFRRLQAPVYACLGNHEYYSGTPAAQQFYRDAGIRLLVDDVAVVDGALAIVGRDDRTNLRRRPLDELVARTDTSQFVIVLDHQPYQLERAEQAGVDFQLSGHTHRGQVWPVSWITDAIYECSWGSHQRGRTRYYVSSGLGIWGGKFRIGTQSEYVVATLTSEPVNGK